MQSGEALRGIAALTSMANEAARTPINLLTANKEQMAKAGEPERKPMTLADFYGSDTDIKSMPA